MKNNLNKHKPMNINNKRTTKREKTQMVPHPVEGEEGMVQVDTTWGEIQPLKIAENVETIDEFVVNDFIEKGLPIIDARTPDFFEVSTIPNAKNISHKEIQKRMDELDPNQPAIFFCNGPQCPQSRWAIQKLLDAGYPARSIKYYRGGMHDWVTMGLPISCSPKQ